MAVIDKAWLLDNILFGVKTTNDDGTELPDAVYTNAIAAAQEHFTRETDIPLGTTDYVAFTNERYDLTQDQDWFFTLHKGPVRAVTEIGFYLGNTQVVEIPSGWINVINAEARQVQLVPSDGSWETISPVIAGWYRHPRRHFAQCHISYTAGYKDSDVPYSVKELIGMTAAIPLLIIFGDLILGAGIASMSISVDGMSQSINSTSSATNSGYGARIIELRKTIKERFTSLRDATRGPLLFA